MAQDKSNNSDFTDFFLLFLHTDRLEEFKNAWDDLVDHAKIYRKEDKEEIKENSRMRRKENREESQEYMGRYCEEHREGKKERI